MQKKNYPVTTYDSKILIESNAISNLEDGRLESFTFELQRAKFPYIDLLGDFIKDKIPRFREIWPLLGAYTENEAWHPDLDEDLEFIGIAHYTILKSLCYIFCNKECVVMNDPDQKYKNIIFHYALIIDCIKQIAFHILKFKNKLDSTIKFPETKLNEEEFMTKMKSLYEDYINKYESFKKVGGLVMMVTHSTTGFLKVINDNQKVSAFTKFNENISQLRNTFIHNPSIDIFKQGLSYYVVSSKAIKNSKTIQSINKLNKTDLIEPSALMNDLFKQMTKMLVDVWCVFYKRIEEINMDKEFKNKRYSP